MKAIDSWIITKLEAFSHFTQKLFGLTSKFWERLSYLIAVCLMLADWTVNEDPILKTLDILLMTIIFLSAIWSVILEKFLNPMFSNPRKISAYALRIIYLILTGFTVPLWLLNGFRLWRITMWFIVLALYFACCDDLPPSESRSWLRSMALRLAQARS